MRSRDRTKLALAALVLPLAVGMAAGANDEVKASVLSRVHNHYQRTKLPDGKLKIETYALADAGATGGALVDPGLDDLPFARIARVLADSLAQRRYFPSSDPEKTDLLIIVSYGRTMGTDGAADSAAHHDLYSQMQSLDLEGGDLMPAGRHPLESLLTQIGLENEQRDRRDQRNARLLGYQEELNRTDTIAQYSAGGIYRGDLLADVEEDRYFVLVVACDFKAATKEKKIRPLWSIRFNTAARRKSFPQALPAMAAFAARYFGQDSGGLMREYVPVGQVDLKPMVELGEAGTAAGDAGDAAGADK